VRAGFAEIAHGDGGGFYMTKGMMQHAPMTHEAALAVPLRMTTPRRGGVVLTDADAKLLRRLLPSDGQTLGSAAVLAAVDEMVAEGADIVRAGVLQWCAARGCRHLIQPLLSRGAQINAKDQLDLTPLMIAASRGGREGSDDRIAMVSALIAFGADKNIVDDDGISALGHYFSSLRRANDFNATFDLEKQVLDPVLRTMLAPARGPTIADLTCVDDH